jgi:hypothetical protein
MREAKEIWAQDKLLEEMVSGPLKTQLGPNEALREEARKARNKRKKTRQRRNGKGR